MRTPEIDGSLAFVWSRLSAPRCRSDPRASSSATEGIVQAGPSPTCCLTNCPWRWSKKVPLALVVSLDPVVLAEVESVSRLFSRSRKLLEQVHHRIAARRTIRAFGGGGPVRRRRSTCPTRSTCPVGSLGERRLEDTLQLGGLIVGQLVGRNFLLDEIVDLRPESAPDDDPLPD